MKDNAISWYTGEKTISVSLSDRKYIGKVRRLAEEFGCDLVENTDGSIYCHLPLEVLKLSKKRTVELSEEQKSEIAARLNAARRKKEVEIDAE